MKNLVVIVLSLTFLSSPGAFAQEQDTSINQFFEKLTGAFNNQDLAQVVDSWNDDGEIITLAGGVLKGHAAIEEEYARSFEGPFKNSNYQYYIQFIRLSDDGAVVDGVWKIAKGPANYPSCGLFLHRLTRKKGKWKIDLATFFIPKTGHTSEVGRTLSWTKICSAPNKENK